MQELYSQVGLALMLATCAAAVLWGGRAARQAAAVVALGWTSTLVLQASTPQLVIPAAVLTLDVAVFAAFLVIAWRRVRGWTVCLLASQGLALAVHGVRAVSPTLSDWGYLTSLALAGYLVLVALAWGVWDSRHG